MSRQPWMSTNRPSIAVLIDPEKYLELPEDYRIAISTCEVDILLVGGSTMRRPTIAQVLADIRSRCDTPLILFPGGEDQLHGDADGVLLPSLFSGRSFDYVIGEHIRSATQLRSLDLPIYSCAYMLLDGGHQSSTAQVTGTKPIDPADSAEIIRMAIAAELIGWSCLYLEGGSGAAQHPPAHLISLLREKVDLPIIIGGGISDMQRLADVYAARPDMIVIGNAIEENPAFAHECVDYIAQRHHSPVAHQAIETL